MAELVRGPELFPKNMVGFKEVESGLGMRGFERVEHVPKSSYRDCSMVVICPTRGVEVKDPATGKIQRMPMVHQRVWESWQGIDWPMNGKRVFFWVSGAEVGKAYDETVSHIVQHPELGKFKYIMTLEDDNLIPPNAPKSLCESIESGFDMVGGLYFTKGDVNMPMCYGDPDEFERTGVLDFRPRDIAQAIRRGMVVPCNGIANGCSLYKMDLFRTLPKPWFVTGEGHTQDLFFCRNARMAGKRVAVDCRVRVGHYDAFNNEVY